MLSGIIVRECSLSLVLFCKLRVPRRCKIDLNLKIAGRMIGGREKIIRVWQSAFDERLILLLVMVNANGEMYDDLFIRRATR